MRHEEIKTKRLTKYSDINDRFRQVRINHRMTQTEMGELVGLSASAIGAMESSFYTPNFSVLRALKSKLNVSYDWLIDGHTSPEDSRVKELEGELVRLRKIIDKLTS